MNDPSQNADAASTLQISAVLGLIILAGCLGGLVNTALAHNAEEENKPFDWGMLLRNMFIGVGAAFLIPLFLQSVSSSVLGTMNSSKAAFLVFFGYCVLGAISARHLITTLTDKVLQIAKSAEKNSLETKKQLEETKKEVGVVKAAGEEGKKVALATSDAIQHGTLQKPETLASPPLPTVTLQMSQSQLESTLQETDPWKNKFEGKPERNSRKLTAELTPISERPQLAIVTLRVKSTDNQKPLTGTVQFFLHPTFANYQPIIPVIERCATLTVTSRGAFTVGALCDDGKTRLELDLADLPEAWEPWKST